MFNKKIKKYLLICALLTGAHFFAYAQNDSFFFKDALKQNREKFSANIISSINRNLSLPLNADNEEDWITAFESINLLKYETAFVNAKINFAAAHLSGRSDDLKKAFLELINSDYPGKYLPQVKAVFIAAVDPALMAMAAHYLLPKVSAADLRRMQQMVSGKLKTSPDNGVLEELNYQLTKNNEPIPSIAGFFSPDYLPGQVLVFSFQRHDRNFPGIAMVRNADGKFVKNNDGSFFAVGQLARSESNMPGYISMGNTPQGIFRMDGFDTSKNFFIGPVTNIQLTMPFEFKASHFYRDSTLNDSLWTLEQYKKLLPESVKNYHPLFETYYAGKAGRTEIIAHGTTVDPRYFKMKLYYPYSPSAGCLVSKEFWNEGTGKLESSDQLALSQAVKNAGGANGYLIVIEIDDKKAPVTLSDVKKYFSK